MEEEKSGKIFENNSHFLVDKLKMPCYTLDVNKSDSQIYKKVR